MDVVELALILFQSDDDLLQSDDDDQVMAEMRFIIETLSMLSKAAI